MVRFFAGWFLRNRSRLFIDLSQLAQPERIERRQHFSRQVGEMIPQWFPEESGYRRTATAFRDYPGQEKACGSRYLIRRGLLSGLNIDLRHMTKAGQFEIESYSAAKLDDWNLILAGALGGLFAIGGLVVWINTPAAPGEDQWMHLFAVAAVGLVVGFFAWAIMTVLMRPIFCVLGPPREELMNEMRRAHDGIYTLLAQDDCVEQEPGCFAATR